MLAEELNRAISSQENDDYVFMYPTKTKQGLMIVRASEDRFDLGITSFKAFLSFEELFLTFSQKATLPPKIRSSQN